MKQRKKNWETPTDFIVNNVFPYFNKSYEYFDPCPLNSDFNGLEVEWGKQNFINPPYNQKDKEAFVKRAIEESKKGNICVCLLPVSTSTKLFHEHILPENPEIRFIKGRIKFKGINSKGELVSDKCGMHDSMLVIFGGKK